MPAKTRHFHLTCSWSARSKLEVYACPFPNQEEIERKANMGKSLEKSFKYFQSLTWYIKRLKRCDMGMETRHLTGGDHHHSLEHIPKEHIRHFHQELD
jgi:hypothetical protein